MRADFILANPPFDMSDWARRTEDQRWHYGIRLTQELFAHFDESSRLEQSVREQLERFDA